MVKRAPVNVRYLWLFGDHILTRSFTARDPNLTCGGPPSFCPGWPRSASVWPYISEPDATRSVRVYRRYANSILARRGRLAALFLGALLQKILSISSAVRRFCFALMS